MLADTDFIIDLMRGEPRAVAKWEALRESGADLVLPAPVVFELFRGVALSRVPEEERMKVAGVTADRTVAELTREAAAYAGELDGSLKRRGRPVDPEDTMIAGIAVARGEPLLTRNVRHFGTVPGLVVERY